MMDDRWLPKILVECANAPLPIEVQRLRINGEKAGMDKEGQPFDLTATTATHRWGEVKAAEWECPAATPMGGGMPMGRPMADEAMGMTLNPAETAELATVEIQGLVYIYMPPDPTILTVPSNEAACAQCARCRRRDRGAVAESCESRVFRVARKRNRHRESQPQSFQLVTQNS